MAHNLYNNTMAFSGETPWHGLGRRFDSAMTAEEALMNSGLNYDVKKEQLYRLDIEPTAVNAFATINCENNEILGYVGNAYEVIQNRDAFRFFDKFVGEGVAIYESAGALGLGEKMWLLAKLPTSFEPIAGDKVDQYVLLYNTHDGSLKCSAMFTPIRVVCQNTLNLALRDNTNIVEIKHTSGARERLETAGEFLNQMNQYFTEMGEKCHDLARYTIDDDFIKEYQDLLFGKEDEIPTRGPGRAIRLNRIEMYDSCLKKGRGVELPGVVGTAWWATQAAIEMGDYTLAAGKKTNDPTDDILFGSIAKFKQKAWDGAFELVEARLK